jgi:predicted MPP superfamily phosphohydrolase
MLQIVFPLVMILVMGGIHLYFYKRVAVRLHLGNKALEILKWLTILNLIGIFGYLGGRYFLDIPNWLYFIFSLSLGIGFCFFVLTLLYELVHFLIHFIPFDKNKRAFIKKTSDITVVALGGAYLGTGIYEGSKEPQVVPITITQNLFRKPYRLVQISDMHIGGLIDEEFVKKTVQTINSLDVDFIVITGDLTDAPINQIKESVSPLQNLKSKFGTFYIVGNHEYFHGLEDTISYLKTLNIIVLENNSLIIGAEENRFNIAGLYDYFGYRKEEFAPDVAKVVSQIDKTLPTLLLAHQPKQTEKLENFKPNLILSGHTHGGQIFPFAYLVKLQQPYLKGLYEISKNEAIYVNSGIGFWGPKMRLGSSAEITLITWQ